jgi:hypothetical protein
MLALVIHLREAIVDPIADLSVNGAVNVEEDLRNWNCKQLVRGLSWQWQQEKLTSSNEHSGIDRISRPSVSNFNASLCQVCRHRTGKVRFMLVPSRHHLP